jgi:hypothetical protein
MDIPVCVENQGIINIASGYNQQNISSCPKNKKAACKNRQL